MLKIDGSYGEGGGSIARVSMALATLTGKGFEMSDIRKGRKVSGLKAQHLQCIKALEQLCDAKTSNVELGSEYLKYEPGEIKAKNIDIDIGTAGSITLLLQALFLPCLFADKKITLTIKGGTCGKWAMPYEYFSNVFLPQIRRFGEVKAVLLKRGYYPKGGGLVKLTFNPKHKLKDFSGFDEFLKKIKEIPKFDLIEQGSLFQIKGISHASTHLEKAKVAERQASAAKIALSKFNCPVDISIEYSNTLCPGSGITLWGIFSTGSEINFKNPIIIGADALGERGKQAEKVGKEAAEKLITEINSKASVDEFLGDNLIQFLGLAGGKIKVSNISKHTKTNIFVVEQFLGKTFDIKGNVIKTKTF